MSTGSREEILSEFVSITAADSERARFYLESSAWELDLALASFYETDGDAGIGISARRSDSIEIIDDNDDIEELDDIPPPPVLKPRTSSDKSKQKPKQKQNSRFATLSSLNKEGSSDEEEGQAFYAGGSEHSGQQVLGPGKKKKNFVSEMFKSVQEHGAEVVDPSNPMPGRVPSNFSGTGYRLGQSSNDTEVVSLPSARRESHREVTLKLWKEGFSVNDGPLREYSNPVNREFLENVRRGEVPNELLQEFRGGEVHLNMEDHSNEEYVMIKPKVQAFGGKGFLLGSPAPAAVGTTNITTNIATNIVDEKDKQVNEKSAQDKIKLDPSAPVTTVLIRFADRTSVQAKFNHSHTIADVRQFITIARPQFNLQEFVLSTTYPNKELKEYSQTLADAGILNAALSARFT